MRKHINSFNKLKVIFSSFLLLAVLFLVVALLPLHIRNSPGSQQQNTVQPQIDNKTQSFEVVNLTQGAEGYVLSLKNISNKNINGYTLSFGDMYKDTDLTTGDRKIAPGEIVKISAPKSFGPRQIITVLAAVFEDNTEDGDPGVTKRLKDRRIGVKIQLERIRPLLEAILKLPDNKILAALDTLKVKISTLSEESENGMSDHVRTGLRSAKQDILTELERLDGSDVRQKLNHIKERQEIRFSRLP